MSRWRDKGYVQDSDEEEDDIETISFCLLGEGQNASSERVVTSPIASSRRDNENIDHDGDAENAALHPTDVENMTIRPHKDYPPIDTQREPTESPDPLQQSPIPQIQNLEKLSTVSHKQNANDFNLEFLENTDDSDTLSDPPSDLEALSPQRRSIVQVVIPPSSTAVERRIEAERVARSFRARKPIQLHPYLLEGERYRQDWVGRGLKPVARPKSPQRSAYDEESQETDFRPENGSPSNTPLDPIQPPSASSRRTNIAITSQHADPLPGKRSRNKSHDGHVPHLHCTLHGSEVHKRRKLNGAPTQEFNFSGSHMGRTHSTGFGDAISNVDNVFAFPQSPPYSSSPLVNGVASVPRKAISSAFNESFQSLPTPSTSSSIRDNLRPEAEPGSDSELAGTRRRGRFQPIPLSSDSSGSDSDASEKESGNDEDVKKVGRRIKGVLPASWLRLDQQAQEKRRAAARARIVSSLSPGKPGPQRGVAQRTIKRTERLKYPGSANLPNNLVVISDDSGDSDDAVPAFHYEQTANISESARDASELAAMFDSRYADDDLADMENDRLHLFTLHQGRKKHRKHQTRLTDSSFKSKKAMFVDDRPQYPKVARPSRKPRATKTKLESARSRVNLRTAPPALSILDIDQSPNERNGSLPQFIRLAVRRAQMRSDQGRHSPRNKHVRLHTSHDTEDADATLQRWRSGQVKTVTSVKTQQENRLPLSDRTANEQSTFPLSVSDKELSSEHNTTAAQKLLLPQAKRGLNPVARTKVPQKLSNTISLAKRSATGSALLPKRVVGSFHHMPAFRAGQLESLESDLGTSQRKIAFERGIQRADQQWAQLPRWQPATNPQLARFLADDDAILPPLPSAEDVGEGGQEPPKPSMSRKGRRLIRKNVAKRVDVETREYRQPSEPAVVDLVDSTFSDDTVPDRDQATLQGLGPFGTQYPTSFDITSLAVGTYFHPSTFIGADELLHALDSKIDLDTSSGRCTLYYSPEAIHCGAWNDETFSRIFTALESIWNTPGNHTPTEIHLGTKRSTIGKDLSAFFRSLIKYFATKLSFLDPIDRHSFAVKMKQLLNSQFDKVFAVHISNAIRLDTSQNDNQCVRVIAYLLVLGIQLHKIAQHPTVDPSIGANFEVLVKKMAKAIVQFLIRNGMPELGRFLESNKRYREREDGIQEKDFLVESLVICIHALDTAAFPNSSFWDLVSQELSQLSKSSFEVKRLESIWATAFTFLPFMEFTASGILAGKRGSSFGHENWLFIRDLLKRLFALYRESWKAHDSSINEYIRANLSRCHVLMEKWQWKRSEPVLGAMFDFFAKANQMQQLQREENKGSPHFLNQLAEQPILRIDPSDRSFQIFLKSVALALHGMRTIYDEKKIRGVVIRNTPNHGRTYPKDRPLDRDNLDALRNHHDLLCTLYWASPPSCRPKLALIQGLVQHESSHREACRLSVRAWANLTLFQFSVDEPYCSLQPFAEWHKEIMEQTLRQYRTAKTEAEGYLKSVQAEGTSDISIHMVKTTIDKNQEQVIATLRDCVAGIHKTVKNNGTHHAMKDFLIDSGIVQLLELPHLDDPRLSVVIRDTLAVFKQYGTHQKQCLSNPVSQPTSEESQDYGDFPDLDELEDFVQEQTKVSALDFVQTPLWHLLSNAFGAESTPNDNLLIECIDVWILVASCQVSTKAQSWSHYIDSYSQVSWRQLRDTEQTRKFKPYFMANLANCDISAYEEHRNEFFNALLTSLVDRESLLRFQHLLLQAIVRTDLSHPMLKNLPFFRDNSTAELDITAGTLRSRRLALISSLLANMRDDVHTTVLEGSRRASETRQEYSELLKSFMVAMKNNYMQLRQGTTVTGAYIEFVQNIIQFLKQYTSDICPVIPFFTDNAAFPLPTTDPTYVVGRLCGYAPKLSSPGTTKQLSFFIQTVAQQAASDNQQQYLVGQLSTALSHNNDQCVNRSAIRGVLIQGIFPAYIEAAFNSLAGLIIARPILQCLTNIFKAMYFDLRVADATSVETMCSNIWSTCFAFIRSTSTIRDNPSLLQQPRTLQAIALALDSIVSLLPIVDYLGGRISVSSRKPATITYISEFSIFAAEVIHDMLPHSIPTFNIADTPKSAHADLLSSCTTDVLDSITNSWTEDQGKVYFGHGHMRKEIVSDLGTLEEEKANMTWAIEKFHAAVTCTFGS